MKASEAPADGTPEWHEQRRLGVGGSDISKMLGLCRFTSPLELWELKTGRRQPEDAGPAAARGHDCEPAVLRRTGEIIRGKGHNVRVEEGYAFHRHPLWDDGVRFQANSDGTLAFVDPDGGEKTGILEAKTAKRGGWVYTEAIQGVIKSGYMLQVQGYMAATQTRWGVISIMVGPGDHNDWGPRADELPMIVFSFRENPALQLLIEQVVKEFWVCVEEDVAPGWKKHRLFADVMRELGRAQADVRLVADQVKRRGWP